MSERNRITNRKTKTPAAAFQPVKPAVKRGLESSAHQLDEQTRGYFEQHFGQDFGNVRIHSDSQAAKSADALNAQAYTSGSDIVFNAGRYQPGTSKGRTLLAHELAHVAQQPTGARTDRGFKLSSPESVAERAAEVSAQRVIAGLHAPASVAAPPGVIHRTIKDDLRKAIEGWGTDEEAIYARLQRATQDEKTAVMSDPVLMQDLYDDLSRSEWGKVLRLLGATAESRVQAASEGWGTDEDAIYDTLRDTPAPDLKRQIGSSTIVMQLRDELNDKELGTALAIIAKKYRDEPTITWAETYHVLVLFPDVVQQTCQQLTNLGVNPATDIIANLPRGFLMPADVVSDVNIQIDNDKSLARVQAAFEARWNLSLTARAAKAGGTVPNWTVDRIRQVNRALQQVPAGHVVRAAQNVAGIQSGEVASFQLDALKPHLGAWDASRGTILVGTEFGDLAGLTRHEVGHAVDSYLGATTVAFKQNPTNGWQWSASCTIWENAMANPWRRRDGTQLSAADQTAIKTVLNTYIQTDGSGDLRAGTPAGHAIRTHWGRGVPMIDAAKRLAGKKDKVWNDLGSVMKIGGQYYSWSAYYNEFYVYNAIVQDQRLTDYSLFGHPEFFAELYEAYYEEGTGPNRGQKLKGVPNWKQFFDNTVHTTVET
jgi:hypothetical protein